MMAQSGNASRVTRLFFLLLVALSSQRVTSVRVEVGELALIDDRTEIPGVTIFVKQPISVQLRGVRWAVDEEVTGEFVDMHVLTTLDLNVVFNETLRINLTDTPAALDVGRFEVPRRGRYSIQTTVQVEGKNPVVVEANNVQAYGYFAAFFPLLLVLVLALTTRMVEMSLFAALFVGSCIVAGGLADGFERCLLVYIFGSVTDETNGYIILFVLFLSGLVSMIERAGGLQGFTNTVCTFAKGPRSGQLVTTILGLCIFLDDYANALVVGQTMKPVLDALSVSREKLAFLVDMTATPVASISPISSWVGFEVGLIQDQLDRILLSVPEEELYISSTGFGVFLQSVRYSYYTFYMIVFCLASIVTKREAGAMLVAERKTQVYQRKDGGDGKAKLLRDPNQQEEAKYPPDTPLKLFNMVIPIVAMIGLVFHLFVASGNIRGEDQTLIEKIEASNSLEALLVGTFAVSIASAIFYSVQIVDDGQLVLPSRMVLLRLLSPPQEEGRPDVENPYREKLPRTRVLVSLLDSLRSYIQGMTVLFPALIVLHLAWSIGDCMNDIGADRLFARLLSDGIGAEWLPTVTFLICAFMGLATGSSWGVMSIMFPLVMPSVYKAADGDADLFYATIAQILSGSIAGTHLSPISDSAVVSCLACDCNLLCHVYTQIPYAMVISTVTILIGTIPVGFGLLPNTVLVLCGAIVTIAIIRFVFVPVLSESGDVDGITKVLLRYNEMRGWQQESLLCLLQADTCRAFRGEAVEQPKRMKKQGSISVRLCRLLERTSGETNVEPNQSSSRIELEPDTGHVEKDPEANDFFCIQDELTRKEVSAAAESIESRTERVVEDEEATSTS